MHFSHAVVLAFVAATASAQYGYSDRSYAGVARRYADPVSFEAPRRFQPGTRVRREAYPEPEPILGINHAKQAYHAVKQHLTGHHKNNGQAGAQGMQGNSAAADMAYNPAAALGRRWAYPEPEARKGHRGGKKHSHGHHKKPGQGAPKGAAPAGAPAGAPPAVEAAAAPGAAPAADSAPAPAAAPAADSAAAAPAAEPPAAAPPSKRWAVLEAYSKLMARNAEPEPENYDEIWERDAEPELEFEERDAEPELEFEERDAEPELEFEERDVDDELYSFIY
ncbi:polyhydroxyalkanoate granule-associated protein [Xylographa parallela]|nr:polyhydroxyalkanoate granule-associated protein [Xylographa parallela]